MKNIKGLKYEDCNLMVYVKSEAMDKFEPLGSLREFKIAPSLMYAILIPFDKLDRLKEWMNVYQSVCNETKSRLQIRSSKDRTKVLYEVKPIEP